MSNWTWQDVGDTPDGSLTQAQKEEIAAEWNLREAEKAKTAYIEQRISAYPPIAEQLDMQYHDNINGTTTWADAIQAVKDKYPKPE